MPRFKPGQSGNPKGRPKGRGDRRSALRGLLEPHAEELVRQLVDRALAGDMTALKLALERILPPIKAQDMPVVLPPLKGALPARGEQVLQAAAGGEISPDAAKSLIDMLTAQARLVEFDDLEKRLAALEEQYAK